MSEQMSVDELAGKMEGCIAFDIDGTFCCYNHKQAEAFILADRKATVERCKLVLESVMDGNNLLPYRGELVDALDGVLEEFDE
jgi:hypothetical protein